MLRRFIGLVTTIVLSSGLGAQPRAIINDSFPEGKFIITALPGLPAPQNEEQLPAAVARLFPSTLPDQWRLHRRTVAQNGLRFLHYQQQSKQYPILGGQLQLRTGPSGELRGISGRAYPDSLFHLPPSTQAAGRLRPLAKQAILHLYPQAKQWNARIQDTLWIPPGLLPRLRTGRAQLSFAIDLKEPAGVLAHRVLLEAETGKILDHFPLHCSLERKLFHRLPIRTNLIWEEGLSFPGQLAREDQEALLATEETYALFWRTFGRDSYDGNGARLNVVTQAVLNNCPNAVASGNRITHCPGVVTDDIVAHEWVHNYLTSMNGLIYQFESGAINEAFADIFGEVVDLLNDRGQDRMDDQVRRDCEELNDRWKIAEGTPALETHLRDLWQPECRAHPSTVDSPAYACVSGQDDFGGVHVNSGPVNRAFSLLTDGGTVDTVEVSGIGMTKAAHIFWHTANNYLGPVTSFHDLAAMLEQSGRDLRGADLTALTLVNLPAPIAPEVISTADLLQLERVLQVVGLRTPPPCNFPTALDPDTPTDCAGASSGISFITIFGENWENGISRGWSLFSSPENPNTWTDKSWALNDRLPNGRPGVGMLAPSPAVGNCRLDMENGRVHLLSPELSLPAAASPGILQFDHYFATETGFDGGVLEIMFADSSVLPVQGGHFIFNPYPGTLRDSSASDNPLAGREAFHGTDHNSDTGSWGTSIVDLSAAGVPPERPFRLRWTMSHDGCTGWVGWYLDDLKVGYCGSASLPVTYRFFSARAEKNRVLLDWALETSEDNAGFFVERRASGEAFFREIGFLAAVAMTYQFTDEAVVPGITYTYRLRQRDRDGTEQYSSLVSATLPEQDFFLAPNPARGLLHLKLSTTTAERGELYDLSGKKLLEFFLQPEQSFRLSTSRFPPGIYLLRVGNRLRKVEFRR